MWRYHAKFKSASGFELYHKIRRGSQDYQHAEIESGEKKQVSSRFALFAFCIFLEGYKARERGNQRSDTADINCDKQCCIVFGKSREQYCGRHVTYQLARSDSAQKRVLRYDIDTRSLTAGIRDIFPEKTKNAQKVKRSP